MTFTVTTDYTQKACTALARALRKTARRKHSRRAHIFGWLVIALGLAVTLPDFTLSLRTALTLLVVLVLLVTLLWEDWLNGYLARKRILPGTGRSVTTFTEEGYHSSTEVGETDFRYDKVLFAVETEGYFILVFSKNHGQVYDKSGLTGGTISEFRQFLEDRIGEPMRKA